jgi:hypothetical protein
MPQVFVLPRPTALDDDANPMAGALAYFFQTGTTTPQSVYVDIGLTTPHTHPLVADSAGRFPKAYYDPNATANYRVRFTTADGVQIYQEDDIDRFTVSQAEIARAIYPRSQAEIAASVTPVNYVYAYGDVRRYGAVGNGVTDDRQAFVDAIASNNEVIVPSSPTPYQISAEILVNKSSLTIRGASVGGSGLTDGSVLRLASGAGASAAIFRWSTLSEMITLKDLSFFTKNAALTQKALRFGELRNTRIERCRFEGIGSSGDDTTAIQFDGTGTFTGDVTIDRCYFTNHLIAVDMQGVCTTIRVVNSEFYATAAVVGSRGVKVANTVTGPTIMGCTFDQWSAGVYSEGGRVKQIGNYFESDTPKAPFEWVRGSGNARIWNMSIADTFQGTATPIYPINDTDACYVLSGPGYADFDNIDMHVRRGFREQGRTVANGWWTTPAYSAGDFTSSSGSWAVEEGDRVTHQFAKDGKTMTITWWLTGTVLTGTPTELRIAIPGGLTASKRTQVTCLVLNNATRTVGAAEVQTTGAYIRVYCDPVMTTNWTAGAVDTFGQISFEIA